MSDRRFGTRSDCRGCGSLGLDLVLSLRPLPVPARGREAAATVPADLFLCRACGLLQLTAVIAPNLLCDFASYEHDQARAIETAVLMRPQVDDILACTGAPATGRVAEISIAHSSYPAGSNDGALLSAFRERGWSVFGIDPVEKATEAVAKLGIPMLADTFAVSAARQVLGQFGPADIAVANHALANIDDLSGFADGLDILLGRDGIFVFETSYAASVVGRILLDTIYHEHLCYFSVRPLRDYFARHGFELFHVQEIAAKGGSIRGFVQRAGGTRPVNASVSQLIATEHAAGLYDGTAFRRMSAAIDETRGTLAEVLARFRDRDGAVAGYGASIGCVSLINQLDLANHLTCVFDDGRLQHAITGPDHSIPVLGSPEIYTRQPALIVVLAWRYADIIMRRHRDFHDAGGRFVLPLPQVTLQ